MTAPTGAGLTRYGYKSMGAWCDVVEQADGKYVLYADHRAELEEALCWLNSLMDWIEDGHGDRFMYNETTTLHQWVALQQARGSHD